MPVVHVEDVVKSYGSLRVLDRVTFDVQASQVVAIIGRSGSGKSTMLRCINGLERIDSGTIAVAGHQIGPGTVDLRALRQEVGIVFQSFNLFPHLTVAQNITLAPRVVKKINRADADAIAERVLRRVGLVEKWRSYPDELSGGQQQRVAIARSLAMEPKVVLFDEVTSALDPELTGEVLRTMEALAEEGMTMILVTHEMSFARNVADLTVFMHKGVVWEQGPSQSLFGDPRTSELRQFVSSGLK